MAKARLGLLILLAAIVLTLAITGLVYEFRRDAAVLGPQPAAARGNEPVQVVCIQVHVDLEKYATTETFSSEMERLLLKGLGKVERSMPALVVYPEDVGAPLVFVNQASTVSGKTSLQSAITSSTIRNAPGVIYNCLRYRVGPFRGLALARAASIGRAYVETFSNLAKKHGVYIVAGSVPLPDFPLERATGKVSYRATSGDVYNVSYFFSPAGTIIGRQKKVHLIELEGPAGLDFSSAKLEEIQVFDTPFGGIGLAICFDGFHKDVLDRLVSLGASILVQPSANTEPWSGWQQNDWLKGAWKAAQDYPEIQYAINPMMTGPLLDLVFEGQSSIVTQVERALTGLSYPLAKVKGGFLAVAGNHDGEDVLVTTLRTVQK